MEGTGDGGTNLQQLNRTVIVGFERQLHVPLMIRVILIIARIMHDEEFGKGQLRVESLVFFKMREEYRQLQELAEFGGGKKIHRQEPYRGEAFQRDEGTTNPVMGRCR